jgi:hypothetical protein
MNSREMFPPDDELSDDPVTFTIGEGPNKKPVQWKLRHTGYKKFEGACDVLRKQNKFALENETMSSLEFMKLTVPAIAQHIFVGWENYPPEKPVPYTREAAEAQMRKSMKCLSTVAKMANDTKLFLNAEIETAGKPLPSVSTGNSDGESSTAST